MDSSHPFSSWERGPYPPRLRICTDPGDTQALSLTHRRPALVLGAELRVLMECEAGTGVHPGLASSCHDVTVQLPDAPEKMQ